MADVSRKTVVRLPREDRVRDILLAAKAEFAANGYAGASMAQIAAQAGIGEASIYRFFPTKGELALKVLADWYEAMIADLRGRLPGIHGVRNKVRFIVWHLLQSLQDNRDLARLGRIEVRNEAEYFDSPIHALNREYTQVLVGVLGDGVRQGALRADLSLSLCRDVIYGGIDHHFERFLAGGEAFDIEHSADQLTALFFEGACVPRAASVEVSLELVERLERAVARLEQGRSAD